MLNGIFMRAFLLKLSSSWLLCHVVCAASRFRSRSHSPFPSHRLRRVRVCSTFNTLIRVHSFSQFSLSLSLTFISPSFCLVCVFFPQNSMHFLCTSRCHSARNFLQPIFPTFSRIFESYHNIIWNTVCHQARKKKLHSRLTNKREKFFYLI